MAPSQAPTKTVLPATAGDAVTGFGVLKTHAGASLVTSWRVTEVGQGAEKARAGPPPYMGQLRQ
jgi:hypothetical protein